MKPQSRFFFSSNEDTKRLNRNNSFRLVLFLSVLLIYGLFAYAFGNESICIFKVYLGLPCPGCGMTRSFLALSRGHLHEAFFWHPLWPLVIIGPVLYGIFDRSKSNKSKKDLLIWTAFVLFVGTYAYRMYLYFPHQAPLDFNPNAYFCHIYELFLKFIALIQ